MQTEEEAICPICKSDKYLNPQLLFLVTPCYHRICDGCVARLFAHGGAPCPVCNISLRRSNLHRAVMEDLKVERECRIRHKISLIFNKRRENFEHLREWNDYLEGVEDVIHSLMTETNVQETQRKLEEYRMTNLDLINQNKRKEEEDLLEVGGKVEKERKIHSSYERKLYEEWDRTEIEHRLQEKHLIDSLSLSVVPAGAKPANLARPSSSSITAKPSFLTDPLWGQRDIPKTNDFPYTLMTLQCFINPLESKKNEQKISIDLLDIAMIHQQMIRSISNN